MESKCLATFYTNRVHAIVFQNLICFFSCLCSVAFPPIVMDRWDRLLLSKETQRPTLLENEVELLLVPKVALYEGELPVASYQEGSLTITNHRLLWRDLNRPLEGSICLSLSLIERFTNKVLAGGTGGLLTVGCVYCIGWLPY